MNEPTPVEHEGPGMGRQHAAAEGIQSVFLRTTLGIGIITGSIVFAKMSSLLAPLWRKIPFIPKGPLPEIVRNGLGPIAWVAAAGITLIIVIGDVERKWQRLNWSLCFLLASGSLVPAGPWLTPFATVVGLIGLHYFIGLWLKSREQAQQWEWEMERQEREAIKDQEPLAPKPNLLKRYSGLAGFEEESGGGNLNEKPHGE